MAVHDIESWKSYGPEGVDVQTAAGAQLALRNWFYNGGTPPIWRAGPWGAGSWALAPVNIGYEIYRLFPSAPAIAGIGFRWKTAESPSGNHFLQFVKSGGYFFALDSAGTPSGALRYYNGSGMVDTGVIVADGAWHYIEVTIDVPNKKCWLSVDGVAILTNFTLVYGALTSVDRMYFLDQGSSGLFGGFADIYFTTGQTTLLGPQRVEGFLPTGDGTYQDFVPSVAGTHYTKVDEAPHNGVTDYVSSNAVNARDSYTHAAMAGTGTVRAVVVTAIADKDNNPPRSLAATVKDLVGTPVPLSTAGVGTFSPKLAQVVTEVDPATSAAWTIAGVNAAQPGVKVTA